MQSMLKAVAKPNKRVEVVEQWKAKCGCGFWARKKFLVLGGESGLGKTEFVRNLSGVDKTLELNCSGIAG
eukprot:1648850-Lingulodinium_polyedra.AAC.1